MNYNLKKKIYEKTGSISKEPRLIKQYDSLRSGSATKVCLKY